MSIGYELVKFVLKLKGEKKSWSKDPIDYINKRKQDIHSPNKLLLWGCNYTSKKIQDSIITVVNPKSQSTSHLILYCHGGGFIYGPTREYWMAVAKIAKQTSTETWMIDYPKAPENTIQTITENIYQVYLEACKQYETSKIILLGDSVGGNLILSLTQRLIQENLKLPNRLIPITPVMDASLTNPKIVELDPIDPILSYKGVLSAKKMCAGNLSLRNPLISPLYGSFRNFPPIRLFMATHDILMPDQELFVEKAKEEGVDIKVFTGEGMPHIWPVLPIMKESKKALQQIISIINQALHNER
ncbi:alpha/beta hydrolase [Aquimarina sp. MMG016]|uniref:alpha/beta hydrolase fold domain-containing protein n=1 Tax=Aquimarina sp. MMG016 TaxID=2822690 RepID=UPI001B39CFC4|nr:alpha/beta hydrolase [Aquimarina sp. MMG016]MBQ4819465.1 alpha/beta hydrolase [Aquimarina sp. MMG016]